MCSTSSYKFSIAPLSLCVVGAYTLILTILCGEANTCGKESVGYLLAPDG